MTMRQDDVLRRLYGEYAAQLVMQTHEKTGDHAHPVFGEGAIGARLMLIGEAPGGEEAKCGKPFVGMAGKQLDSMLQQAGIVREEVFVTNAVKYRPTNVKPKSISNRTPTGKEVEAGSSLLLREIELVSPCIIATLGNTPLNAVLKLSGKAAMTVGEAHGKALKVGINGNEYTLFALYHPASVIYNRSLKPVLEQDIYELGLILREREAKV